MIMETGAQNLNMLMKSSMANNNYFRSIIVNSVRLKEVLYDFLRILG
jgi:hypothetical protein